MRIVVIAPQEPAAFFDLLWQGVWEATFDIAQFGVEVANVTPPRHDVEAQRSILADLLHERVPSPWCPCMTRRSTTGSAGTPPGELPSSLSIPTPPEAGGRYL